MGKEFCYIPPKLSFDEFFCKKRRDFDFFQENLLARKKRETLVFQARILQTLGWEK